MRPISTLVFLLALSAAPARAGDPTPDRYQESYALEAAYNYDRALRQLAGIPAEGPDAYLLPLRRGWLLYLLGRYEESVTAYRRAIAADSAAIEAHLGLTLPLMALRRWGEAEAATRAVLARAPGNYRAQSRLAYCLYSAGKHAPAAEVYAELVAAYPADVDMRTGLGWARLKLGDTAGARSAFADVLHLVPDHSSAQEGMTALR